MNESMSTKDAYAVMLTEFPDVMDIQQMSQALGISTKTSYQLLKSGAVSFLKIGRSYRVPKVKLLAYLQADSCVLQ